MTPEINGKLSYTEFAAKIKAKEPEHKGRDDYELVEEILQKYPVYKKQVDFPKKKPKMSYTEFAAKIKAKEPEHKGRDDYELVEEILQKYPVYKKQVDLKKKSPSVSDAGQVDGELKSQPPSKDKGITGKPPDRFPGWEGIPEGEELERELNMQQYELGEAAIDELDDRISMLEMPLMGTTPTSPVSPDQLQKFIDNKKRLPELKSERARLAKEHGQLIDGLVDPVVDENRENYLTEDGQVKEDFRERDVYGFGVANLEKVNEQAERLFPDHLGLQRQYAAKIRAEIQAGIDVPQDKLQKRVNEVYYEQYGKSIDTEYQDAYRDARHEISALQHNYDEQATAEARKIADPIEQRYEQLTAQYDFDVNNIRELLAASTHPDEQGDLGAELERVQKEYNSQVVTLNEGEMKAYNEVSMRWNRKFQRDQARILDATHQRIKKEGLDPKVSEQITGAYNQAAEELLGKANKKKEAVLRIVEEQFPGTRLITSTLSSFGGAVRGLSQGEFGEGMEQYFVPSIHPIKEVSDLDLFTLSESTGNLMGSMTPSLLASAAAGLLTKNASLSVQIMVTGTAGFMAETADLAGRAKVEALERTGSEVEAARAADETIKGQLILLPTYAVTSLPFVKGFMRKKSLPVRVSAGGAVEYGGEFIQEYPQNLQEVQIRETGEVEGFLQNASWQSAKETALNLIPAIIPGVVGPFSQQTDKAVKRSPGLRHQYMSQLAFDKGIDFAKTHISNLYINGIIDEEVYHTMGVQLEMVEGSMDKGEKYNSLMLQKHELQERANATPDEVEKKALNTRAKQMADQMEKMLYMGEDDVVEIKTEDSKFFMTQEDFANFTVPQGAEVIDPVKEREKEEAAKVAAEAAAVAAEVVPEEAVEVAPEEEVEAIPEVVAEVTEPTSPNLAEEAPVGQVEIDQSGKAKYGLKLKVSNQVDAAWNRESSTFEFHNKKGEVIEDTRTKGYAEQLSQSKNLLQGWWDIMATDEKKAEVKQVADQYLSTLQDLGDFDQDQVYENLDTRIMEYLRGEKFMPNKEISANVADFDKGIWHSGKGRSLDDFVHNTLMPELEAEGFANNDEQDITNTILDLIGRYPKGITKGDVKSALDELDPRRGLVDLEEDFLLKTGLDLQAVISNLEASINAFDYGKERAGEAAEIGRQPEEPVVVEPAEEERPGEKIEEEPAIAEPKPLTAKERAKNKIAEGTEEFLAAIGGLKQIDNAEQRAKVLSALKKISEGFIEGGIATIDELIKKLKTHLKGKVDPKIIDDFRDDLGGLFPEEEPAAEKEKAKAEPGAKKEEKKEKKPEEPEGVGIKKALTRAEALEAAEGLWGEQHFDEIFDESKRLVDSGEVKPDDLIREILDQHRPISPLEMGILMYETRRIHDQIDDVTDEATKAEEEGDGITKSSAEARLSELDLKLLNTEIASTLAGKPLAMALSMRRFLVNSKYNLASVIKRYKKHNKGKISKEQIKKFEGLDKELKKIQQKQRRHEKKKEKEKLEKLKGKLDAQEKSGEFEEDIEIKQTKRSAKETTKRIADRIREGKLARPGVFNSAVPAAVAWDSALEATALAFEASGVIADAITQGIIIIQDSEWYQGLSKRRKKQAEKAFAEYNNDIYDEEIDQKDERLKIPYKLLRKIVEQEGINTIEDVVNALSNMDALKNFTSRQIRDAVTNYGEQQKMPEDKIRDLISEMKGVGRLLSALEDVEDKKQRPLRTGRQRRNLTDRERKLRRKLHEAMKGLPITEEETEKHWKTALDTIKANLRNQIKDYTEQLESGKKSKEKKGIEYDAEAFLLKEQRDILREILNVIEGKRLTTNEQRVKYAITAAENAIGELERRIMEKDFGPAPKLPPLPENERLDLLLKVKSGLQEKYRKLKLDENPPKTPEEIATDRALKGVLKDIKNLKEQIKHKRLAYVKRQSLVIQTPMLKLAKKEKKHLLEVLNKLREQAGIAEQRRLEIYKKAKNKKTQELRQRLKDGDYSPRSKRRKLELDDEAVSINAEYNEVLRKYELEFERNKLANRTLTQKAVAVVIETLNLPKALVTTFDMSAVTRQGLIFLFAKPHLVPGAFKQMIRQTIFKKKAKQWMDELKASPDYDLMMQSGLFISDPLDPRSRAREEQKQSAWASKMWVTKWYANPSERAYSGYLNALRVAAFRNAAKKFERLSVDPKTEKGEKIYKLWADYVNNATGRARTDKFGESARAFSSAFFSFSFLLSRFNILFNWGKFYGFHDPARREALKTTATFLGVGAMMLFLAWWKIGVKDDDDDEFYVEVDPRSSDFAKLVIKNHRVDIWGGFQPLVRSIVQLFTGAKKSIKTGEIRRLGEGYKAYNEKDVGMNFFSNKLAPMPSFAGKYWLGHWAKDRKTGDVIRVTGYGEPLIMSPWHIGSEPQKLLGPMMFFDSRDAIKELGPIVGGALTLAAFFGSGVQSMPSEEQEKALRRRYKIIKED